MEISEEFKIFGGMKINYLVGSGTDATDDTSEMTLTSFS